MGCENVPKFRFTYSTEEFLEGLMREISRLKEQGIEIDAGILSENYPMIHAAILLITTPEVLQRGLVDVAIRDLSEAIINN